MKTIEKIYYWAYRFLQRYGISLAYLAIAIFFLLLASCSTVRKSVEYAKIDSAYLYKTDTLRVITHTTDTVHIQDSVIIYRYEKGDTLVLKERVVRNNYNSKNKDNDKSEVKADTVTQYKYITNTVEVTKEPSAWAKFLETLKGVAIGIGSFLLVLIGLWGYNKFKKK